MNVAPFPSLAPRDVIQLLLAKRKLLIACALGGGLLAAAYSLIMPRYWEASQGLVVRQETAGARGLTPGKFADLYEMRTLQETILELAKSQQVVVDTLTTVNRKTGGASPEPTLQQIEEFRKRLKMLPPNGAEFGKTEVFYFYVKDRNRQRAIDLVSELCRQVDEALQELRIERAQSLVDELQQQVNVAAELTAEQTDRLSAFEKQVGADLGELRMLHSASSGQSDLRTEAVQLESELRRFKTQVRESEELLKILQAAQQNPQTLIATPNSLLVAQPALKQLKDGLIAAQINRARLAGTRSSDHPQVQAAVESEEQIRRDLHQELQTAVRGAEVERRLAEQRVAATQERLANVQRRLANLAEQRAEYSNRVAAVDNSRMTLDEARRKLSIAKAAEAAARGASLVTRIDQPETGPYPAGPGRKTIAAAGMVAGLGLGFALVFLGAAAPTPARPGDLVGVRPLNPDDVPSSRPSTTLANGSGAPPTQRPTSAKPWDVETRRAADRQRQDAELAAAPLAAASKDLIGAGRGRDPNGEAMVSSPADKKRSLPVPPGVLPAASGALPTPSTATPPRDIGS